VQPGGVSWSVVPLTFLCGRLRPVSARTAGWTVERLVSIARATGATGHRGPAVS
jgi:hypothetical protein